MTTQSKEATKVYSIGFHLGTKFPYFTDISDNSCIDFDTAIKSMNLISQFIINDNNTNNVSLYFGGGYTDKHFKLVQNIYNYIIINPICSNQIVYLDISTDAKHVGYDFLKWLQDIQAKSLGPCVAFSARTSHKNIDYMLDTFAPHRNIISNPYGMSCVAYYVDDDVDIDTILKDLEKLSNFSFCNCLILPKNTYCAALLYDNEDEHRWSDIFRETINWYLNFNHIDSKFKICLYERYRKLIAYGKQDDAWFSQCGIFLDSKYTHTYTLANGLIYPCSGAPYYGEEYSIGNINTGFDWNKIEKLKKNISTYCSSCSISDYCFKGCYIVEKPNGRENNHNNRFSCKMQKIIYDTMKSGLKL